MKLRLIAVALVLVAAVALVAVLAGPAKAQSPGPIPPPGPFDLIENHFKCYDIYAFDGVFPPVVDLKDQFESVSNRIVRARFLCNPVKKNNTEPPEPDIHLVCYEILEDPVPPPHKVELNNQFGTSFAKVQKPELLCLPSKKQELF
jgi:hypothetical protein